MELNQKQRIINLHSDNQWHCSTEIEWCRDQRKRISEINKDGKYYFEAQKCDGRCGKKHSSNLFMRRMINKVVFGFPVKTDSSLKPNEYYFSQKYYEDRKPKEEIKQQTLI